jgi:hypothetical protein
MRRQNAKKEGNVLFGDISAFNIMFLYVLFHPQHY